MQSFRNLKVWEKAHAVTLDIYSAGRSFPKDELYGLTTCNVWITSDCLAELSK